MRLSKMRPPRSVAVRYWCRPCRRKTRFLGSPMSCLDCGRPRITAGTPLVMCDVCGDVFKNDLALQGHRGGQRGKCGMSQLNTMWEALDALVSNAVLVGRDGYHIATDDFDRAMAALPDA